MLGRSTLRPRSAQSVRLESLSADPACAFKFGVNLKRVVILSEAKDLGIQRTTQTQIPAAVSVSVYSVLAVVNPSVSLFPTFHHPLTPSVRSPHVARASPVFTWASALG
jgi:hypothetical protein